MNQELQGLLVGGIQRVRARLNGIEPWEEWADAVLAGASTTSWEAIEAAAEAAALAKTGPESQQGIVLAAHAMAHATAMAVVHGDAAMPVVKWAIGVVDRELGR